MRSLTVSRGTGAFLSELFNVTRSDLTVNVGAVRLQFVWSDFIWCLGSESADMEDEERRRKLEAGKAKVGEHRVYSLMFISVYY